MRIDVKCKTCRSTRDHFAELNDHSCAVELVIDSDCPVCKVKPKSRDLIIQCAKCNNICMVAVLWDSDEKPVICIDPVCSSCKEKEEEKKFDRDMGVVGPAQIECAACGRLNPAPNNLGVVIGPGLTYFCACGAQVKLIKIRKQNVWGTEKLEKATPTEGDWIEVTDNTKDYGFGTRIATGGRSEDTGQVLIKTLGGKQTYAWTYWRYLGEKKWRR